MEEKMEKTAEKIKDNLIVRELAGAGELAWINPGKLSWEEEKEVFEIRPEEIDDAQERLQRFAPLILRYFPETWYLW